MNDFPPAAPNDFAADAKLILGVLCALFSLAGSIVVWGIVVEEGENVEDVDLDAICDEIGACVFVGDDGDAAAASEEECAVPLL
ncbi:hypothetical protein BGZ65_011370 [Modicella reniformis]|uniref:Uncharacterized protein n=1 Tax=Modicella reniformis TaxID=1440133 RepID=A0A9P6M7T5_9FUNG|nr:hypothetical protein BGZ65_011370 [Modicella reniformis]